MKDVNTLPKQELLKEKIKLVVIPEDKQPSSNKQDGLPTAQKSESTHKTYGSNNRPAKEKEDARSYQVGQSVAREDLGARPKVQDPTLLSGELLL